jgi:hypothetical protein
MFGNAQAKNNGQRGYGQSWGTSIKEGKEKRLRRFQDTLTLTKRTTQRIIEKEQKNQV